MHEVNFKILKRKCIFKKKNDFEIFSQKYFWEINVKDFEERFENQNQENKKYPKKIVF